MPKFGWSQPIKILRLFTPKTVLIFAQFCEQLFVNIRGWAHCHESLRLLVMYDIIMTLIINAQKMQKKDIS